MRPTDVLDFVVAVWGSLGLVLEKVDLFTLYVALELLTFAAVPLCVLIVLRVWFDAMPVPANSACMQLLGALGAAAVLFGSIVALRQKGLKLSSHSRRSRSSEYLFLMFPLAFDPATGKLASGGALAGGISGALGRHPNRPLSAGEFARARSVARALWLLILGQRSRARWELGSA